MTDEMSAKALMHSGARFRRGKKKKKNLVH